MNVQDIITKLLRSKHEALKVIKTIRMRFKCQLSKVIIMIKEENIGNRLMNITTR